MGQYTLKSCFAAVAVFAVLISFQNFTSEKAQTTSPPQRVVKPMSMGNRGPASVAEARVACDPRDRRALYLKINAPEGSRFFGSIENAEKSETVDLDLIIGRDSTAGSCDESAPPIDPSQGVKVCFSESSAMYFRLKLSDEAGKLVVDQTFPSYSYCEHDPEWVANDIQVGSGQ